MRRTLTKLFSLAFLALVAAAFIGYGKEQKSDQTKQGVALTLANCSRCHSKYLPDRTLVLGAPGFDGQANSGMINTLQPSRRVLGGAPPFYMGPAPSGTLFYGPWLYQAYGVPWVKNDINERVKSLTREEYLALNRGVRRGGGFPRWNGSLYYPAKMPDLIGLKEQKYLDHTATHLHRNIGDLMRYSALVSFAESAEFGPHRMLAPETKRATARLPDEALYAMELYIYSMQPPRNPNPFDEKAKAGQKVFAREGCAVCHTPPLYMNNKLTLAEGFTPPKDAPTNGGPVLTRQRKPQAIRRNLIRRPRHTADERRAQGRYAEA